MRRRVLMAMVVAAFGALGTAHAADEPTGTWKVRMSFGGRGGRVSILKLQREGDKLTGVMLGSQGPATTLSNVSYKDDNISFEMSREWNGQEFTSKYTGTFTENTINGTVQSERRGRSRTLNWEATRTTAEEISRDFEVPPVDADIDLNHENYELWRDHILPDESELAWEQIPWLTTFKDGILAADAAGKPLLFWTMNGHPLGCT